MITRNNIIVAFCSLLWLLFYEAPMSAQHMLEDVKSMFEKSKIYPDGTVYFTDDDGEKYAIPFATVSVYEKDDRDKLVYYVMADRFGHYRIPKYDYTKPFYYVLEAPGFVPKGELVDELPTVRKWDNDKPLTGNYSISFEVEKDSLSRQAIFLTSVRCRKLKEGHRTGRIAGACRSRPWHKVRGWRTVDHRGRGSATKNNRRGSPARIVELSANGS